MAGIKSKQIVGIITGLSSTEAEQMKKAINKEFQKIAPNSMHRVSVTDEKNVSSVLQLNRRHCLGGGK